MAFVYLPPITVDDLSQTASDHRPRPVPLLPRPPLDLTPPPCLAVPQAIPLIPTDLQIGRQQLLAPHAPKINTEALLPRCNRRTSACYAEECFH